MPAISVVVPIHGVERYLDECLQSLQVQTFDDIEIVLVDDDSPDGSTAIAQAWAARDERFLYVHQANRGPGPGGGRNGGLATATGDWITFTDADDVVTPTMLHDMVVAGRDADADLVTCNTARLLGGSVRRSEFHDISHPRDQASTTVAESPWLILDSTPWNKLFRRDFFDRVVGEWPEKVLYEDIAPMTRAHLGSRRTASLAASHYYWRIRPDGGSITAANRSTKGDLAQMRALHDGLDAIEAAGDRQAARWFGWKALGFDLHWMTGKIVNLDAGAADELAEEMARFVERLDPALLDLVSPARRKDLAAIAQRGRGWRTAIRTRRSRVAATNRAVPVAERFGNPKAVLTRWKVEGDQIALDVAVSTSGAPTGPWALELADRSLTGSIAQEPVVSIAALAQTSQRVGPSEHVNFRIPLDTFDDLGDRHLHAAVRGPGAVGEIGRSLGDRVRSRGLSTRFAATGHATVAPYFDNNRLFVSTLSTGHDLVDAHVHAGALIIEVGPVAAPWALTPDNSIERVAFWPLDRHLSIDFEPDGTGRWRLPLEQIGAAWTARDNAWFLAAHRSDAPSVPVPIRCQAQAVLAIAMPTGPSLEIAPAAHGQAALRPPMQLISDVKSGLRRAVDAGYLPRI